SRPSSCGSTSPARARCSWSRGSSRAWSTATLPCRRTWQPNSARPTAPPTAPPDLRGALTRRPGGSLVLTTARLDSQKGIPHLVRAAAHVPEATFVLAGDGPLRPQLEALAQEVG